MSNKITSLNASFKCWSSIHRRNNFYETIFLSNFYTKPSKSSCVSVTDMSDL